MYHEKKCKGERHWGNAPELIFLILESANPILLPASKSGRSFTLSVEVSNAEEVPGGFAQSDTLMPSQLELSFCVCRNKNVT
jgi:hypothetical protein